MIYTRFFLLLLWAALFTTGEDAAIAQVARRETLILLNDVRREQWCAYKDESAWRDAAIALGAGHFAEIDFINRMPQTVVITLNADSGDWAVEDTYSLASSRDPRRLKRRILHESGGFVEETIFAIEKGEARIERRETKSAYSGQVMNSQRDPAGFYFFADPPIMLHMEEFPFSSILAGKHPDVWTRGQLCVKSDPTR